MGLGYSGQENLRGVMPSAEDVPNAKMGPDPFCHWCCGGLPPANSFQVIFKAEYRLDVVGLLFLDMLVLNTSFFVGKCYQTLGRDASIMEHHQVTDECVRLWRIPGLCPGAVPADTPHDTDDPTPSLIPTPNIHTHTHSKQAKVSKKSLHVCGIVDAYGHPHPALGSLIQPAT